MAVVVGQIVMNTQDAESWRAESSQTKLELEPELVVAACRLKQQIFVRKFRANLCLRVHYGRAQHGQLDTAKSVHTGQLQ